MRNQQPARQALLYGMKPITGNRQRDLFAQSVGILKQQFIKISFLSEYILQILRADPQRLS
jgi:hypothetical protein